MAPGVFTDRLTGTASNGTSPGPDGQPARNGSRYGAYFVVHGAGGFADGHRRLTPDTVVPAHVSGDISVLHNGDLAWAFVAATPDYRAPPAGSPTTTVLSPARLRPTGK